MFEKIFLNLNPQQKKAVENISSPSIILAGAGSGKTRVLIAKVLNLIINYKIDPKNILMITFTNKAAYEMKRRIGNDFSLGFVGTFHSFCARILRVDGEKIGLKKNFVIYDESDQLNLVKTIIKENNLENQYSPAYYLSKISFAKNAFVSPEKYLDIFNFYNAEKVQKVYFLYQKSLKENQSVDFDDLINLAIKLFDKEKKVLEKYQNIYRYILIDEFQDTNYSQYLLTKKLGEKFKNITIVGDFSQSIYSWRGAEIDNLKRFEKDFPESKIFYLEKNYRSTQPILDFAYQVISKNQTHPILSLYTDKKGGKEVIFYEAENEEDEAFYLASNIFNLIKDYRFDDIAVLYRTNAQSRVIEEVFLHQGIPYLLVGGTRFYERKEIKDVLSYLRLVLNPKDKISQERIKKLGKKRWEKFSYFLKNEKDKLVDLSTSKLIEKIFEISDYLSFYDLNNEEDFYRLENIKELKSVSESYPKLDEFLNQVALVESEYFQSEKIGEAEASQLGKVRLTTIHQAKGLEFKVVFIVGLEEGLLPHAKSLDDLSSIEEERRLFYVAITRAKECLYVTYARKRFIFGTRSTTIKSRFLEEAVY